MLFDKMGVMDVGGRGSDWGRWTGQTSKDDRREAEQAARKARCQGVWAKLRTAE